MRRIKGIRNISRGFILALSLASLYFVVAPQLVSAITVTTTIAVSICNNGIPDANEVCDDGAGNNTGAYASTTAGRYCSADCRSFGPYCGDGILMPLYSEQCDDANAVNGDFCTDHCQLEATSTTVNPNTGGSTGGGSGAGGNPSGFIPSLLQTKVSIYGKAYPNASVNILKDGQVLGVAQADSNADFSYDSGTLTPGATTFGFWSTDAKGLRSITFTTTFQVTQNAVTTVSNVYLPPTIDLTSKKVALGDVISAFGSSAPNANIMLYVNKEKKPAGIGTTSAQGAWSLGFTTDGLANESFHTVKAMFETVGSGAQAKSGYSQLMSFYVGQKDVKAPGSADLNSDGKVNLVDFSILLFHWNTSDPTADLNVDSKVNLTDFSILLFAWTG